MDEFPQLQPNYRYTPHMILMSIIFFFQYFTKAKEVSANLDPHQKKIGNKIFWKYIIIFQLAKAADWSLGPYVYEFFEKYHRMNVESTAKMMAISYLANLLFGPLLVGYLNDKSDKKFPCLLYAIVLSTSCLVRQIKNPFALIISQITFGMSSSILYTSFENWFVAETNSKITDKNVKDVILSATFEKSIITDSFTAVGVSVITGILKKQYGIQAPFYFSVGISIIVFTISCIFLTSLEEPNAEESKHEFVDVLKNIKASLVVCKDNPFILLIGMTESLLFATLHIFLFCWSPALKELNPEVDTSEVFTLFMMALMMGGSSFRAIYLYFNTNSFKVAKVISLLCCISFLIVNLYPDYKMMLYGFLIYEVSVGMLYPTYSKIKSEYLPAASRGTLMNVFKIPLNIIVIFMLLNMNRIFNLGEV